MRDSAASRSSAKSAERLLDILRLLAGHPGPLPTMTIARECGIPKSSAHHLLNVMRARSFVTYYEAEHAWGLGVSVFEIGSAYLRSGPLERLGRQLLVELTARAGETAHLAILRGTEVLYIDKETPGVGTPRLVTEIGTRLPAHLTAVGRAMLAALPAEAVRAAYAGASLTVRTGRGPATVDALLDGLEGVRRDGIAVDDEMVTPGISCLACPVFSRDGSPAAAIGVTYVTAQRDAAGVEQVAALLRDASDRLSAALGHAPASVAAPAAAAGAAG